MDSTSVLFAEEKMMMLRRWAVREHFVSGAYL